MGRLPIRLGLICLLVGVVGAAFFSWRASTLPALTNDMFSECRPGEIGVVEQRRAAPDSGGQRSGSTEVFCVDQRGGRRVVTDDLPAGMAGSAAAKLTSMMYSAVFALVAALGMLLIMLGFLARRRTRAPAGMSPAAQPADLADRLRQLTEARAANLISQAEHDRLRDDALQAMRGKS